MCGGIQVDAQDAKTGHKKSKAIYFPIPHAQIPVLTETGKRQWLQWEKRKGEDPELDIPVTGWARLLSLKEGTWNRYHPKRVLIPALGWMEKDAQRQSHWFDLESNTGILGIRIDMDGRGFVYVVTRPAQGEYRAVHHRMPLIVPQTATIHPSSQ